MAHTPGPWRAVVNRTTVGIYDMNGTAVAMVVLPPTAGLPAYDRKRADARLIAAAPEMFKTLEELLASIDASGPHDECQRLLDAARAQARAAIAAAKEPLP